MATLHHPAYEYRDFARRTDTPVFHAVEQTLHAGWLFDSRLPARDRPPAGLPRAAATPGMSHRAQPGGRE